MSYYFEWIYRICAVMTFLGGVIGGLYLFKFKSAILDVVAHEYVSKEQAASYFATIENLQSFKAKTNSELQNQLRLSEVKFAEISAGIKSIEATLQRNFGQISALNAKVDRMIERELNQ